MFKAYISLEKINICKPYQHVLKLFIQLKIIKNLIIIDFILSYFLKYVIQ